MTKYLTKLASVAGLACCVTALTGCGAARPCKYYQLTLPTESATAGSESVPVVLLIGAIRASTIYRQDQIVYSGRGVQMGTYEYQRWAEPPTEMIGEVLLQELRASGHYRGVYEMRSSTHGDYLLHGRLYDFKEVDGNPSVARMSMDLELKDVKTGSVVWNELYRHDEPVDGKDVSAIATALDRNAQQCAKQVASQLQSYFAAHPPTSADTLAAQ